MLKFTFQGAWQAVVDDGSPPTITASTIVPSVFLGVNLTVHLGFAAAFESLEVDKGNELAQLIDANHANGIKGTWITAHNPTIKLNPEMITVASHDYYGRWKSGATGVIQTGVIGITAGNRIQFQANRTQYEELAQGEREGGRILDLTARCTVVENGAVGDDYSLILT